MTGNTPEALTEGDRRPLIDADGRRLLRNLLEHSAAPRYNHTCGDRLTTEKLATVRAFDRAVRTTPPFSANQPPGWVMPFAARCVAEVPVYRPIGTLPPRFEDLPTFDRADLIEGAQHFVPDDHPLDDLALFATTGTSTGQAALIPSTPVAAASYGALLGAAMEPHGLDLHGGPGQVAVAQICWQRHTYTYASISSLFNQAALLKLNLNPDDWRHPDHAASFLDDVQAEVYTGDPIAFAKLAELGTTHRPKALLSSAMTLPPDLHDELVECFGCPVIDVYGMNEAGPIAAATPDGSAHRLLQPNLYLEILDDDGDTCPPGQRGEITLTGGFNSALPLLRYRTGDVGALETRGGGAVLVGLEGRDPVPLESANGRAVNTIDARAVLGRHVSDGYTFHQAADRSIRISFDAASVSDQPELLAELSELFGGFPVTIDPPTSSDTDSDSRKVSYSSDLVRGARRR